MTDCKVIAVDFPQDLALIEIPQADVKDITPLKFFSGNVKDGLEVWSAGYPGLISSPTWQLARGNITNERMNHKEDLPVQGLDFVIQHSASIDGGNSGGPLLVQKGEIYSIAGINTWSVNNRNNTFFAIPGSYAREFITQFGDIVPVQDKTGLEKSLKETNQKFLEYLTSGNIDDSVLLQLKEMIGDGLIDISGWTNYKTYRATLEKEDKNTIDGRLIHRNTYEVMKEAIIFNLNKKMQNQENHFESINGTLDTDSTHINLMVNGKKETITWARRFNKWVVIDTSLLEKTEFKASGTTKKDTKQPKTTSGIDKDLRNQSLSLHGGLLTSFPKLDNSNVSSADGTSFFIDGKMSWMLTYFAFSLGIRVEAPRFSIQSQDYGYTGLGMNLTIRGQLPLLIAQGKLTMIPFLGAGYGFKFASFVTESETNQLTQDGSPFPLVGYIPVSLGLEMTTHTLKNKFWWGLEFSYLIDLSGFKASVDSPDYENVGVDLTSLNIGLILRLIL